MLRLTTQDGRVLITHDLGSSELAVRLGQSAAGVVILSLYELPAGLRERYGAERVLELGDRSVGHLVVIEPGRLRLLPEQESGPSE